MPDIVSPGTRSRMMAGIRSQDTRPEMLLRRALHRDGFRYRLHDKRLPGRPDMTFPRYRAALFVHGCFWHGHAGCRYFKVPSTRREFWVDKIDSNRARDQQVLQALEAAGWRVGIVWECATREKPNASVEQVEAWLRGSAQRVEVACL